MVRALKFALFLCSMFIAYSGISQEFVPNLGQWEGAFQYKFQFQSATVYLRQDGLRFHLVDPALRDFMHNDDGTHRIPAQPVKNHVFDVLFHSSSAKIKPQKKVSTYHNYFLGKDVKNWKGRVPIYKELEYQEVYEGIDLLFESGTVNLKYNFILKPGADPTRIKWTYEGVEGLRLDNGRLVIETSVGRLVEEAPIAWQIIEGSYQKVDVSFVLKENDIAFSLGEFNPEYELIIDPNFVFSTYTGSVSDNFGYTATYDESGNAFGGGIVFGGNYPTTTGAFQTAYGGGMIDVSITKFSSDGTSLIYSTFLGGTNADQPHSMMVDSLGNLLVLGATGSANFPVTPTAFDTSYNGGPSANVGWAPFNNGVDMFIVKFSPAGDSLIGATYLGGTESDGANLNLFYNYGDPSRGEVISASSGEVYFASSTKSTDFPTAGTGVFRDTLTGGQDAIIGCLNYNLSSLLWATYLGGTNQDAGFSLKLNSDETTLYAAGASLSADFPTDPLSYQPLKAGTTDGWIASFNAANGAYITSTFNGTSDYDQNFFVALDFDDDVYVFGQTKGAYPTTPGLWSVPNSSQFIHKFSPDLKQSLKSTVFGSGDTNAVNISPTALMVDACKSVYISGWGGVTNIEGNTIGMPVTPDARDTSTDGSDFYFLVLDGSWQFPEYATFFGGNGAEHVDGGTSRFSPTGTIYQAVCAGCGGSSSFPAFPPSVWSTTNNSANCNLACVKVDFELQAADVDVTINPDSVCIPYQLSFIDKSKNVDIMLWDFGDGTNFVGRNPVKVFDSAGTYNITIVGIDTLCNTTDTSVVQITTFKSLAQAAFISDYDTCGLPFQVHFTNQSTNSTIFNWDFGDGTQSTIANPTKVYAQAGTYTIALAVRDAFCQNWDTAYATILFKQGGGLIDFDINYDLCADWQTVNLVPWGSIEYQVYNWDFGDGNTSNSRNTKHSYSQPGTYQISFEAIDTICKNETKLTQTITIEQYAEVDELFPNVFSPNHDGVNDTWQLIKEVYPSQFTEFHLEVFNRWGSQVYVQDNATFVWDGFYLDALLSEGVYFWIVWYTDICNNKAEKHGNVHLLR